MKFYLIVLGFALMALDKVAFAQCSEQDTASSFESPTAGPWNSQNGKTSFLQIRGRHSWWVAEDECRSHGFELPTWEDIATDYRYLKGTTPLVKNAFFDWGCPAGCPFNFWTAEESSDLQQAHLFETVSPNVMDPRPLYKDHRSSVLCVLKN